MYPASFEYERAQTVNDALGLLAEHAETGKILAGGASLVPLMKLRLARPQVVIDIGQVSELAGMSERDHEFVIGAVTHHVAVEQSARVRSLFPLLYDLTSGIGDPQVRNMGTVGGAVVEADPAGDWAPGLLALNATIRCASRRGTREVAAREFYVDAYTTALAHDELVTEITFPSPRPRSGGAHVKLERRAGDFAIICVSVQLTLNDAGRYDDIGIGVGGIGLTPVKVAAAEALLRGQEPNEQLLQEAAHAVSTCSESFSDIRGSAAYRQQVAGTLFRRALSTAERRALSKTVEVTHD